MRQRKLSGDLDNECEAKKRFLRGQLKHVLYPVNVLVTGGDGDSYHRGSYAVSDVSVPLKIKRSRSPVRSAVLLLIHT